MKERRARPIFLREFLGYNPEDATKYKIEEKELKEAQSGDKAHQFTVLIEAIHCPPIVTGNYTRYTKEACNKALKKWTEPYRKPVILFHNDYDGHVVGRIIKAEMGISQISGGDCLLIEATAPDWETQDKLRTEILKTVSIGVEGTDVRCSICGANHANGEHCEHVRGRIYEGQICYWDVHDFEPEELSYVIVPSDKMAQVIKINDEEPIPIDIHDNEPHPIPLHNNENRDPLPGPTISIEESQNKNLPTEGKNTMPADIELKLKESQAMVDSLQAEKKAWSGEKIALTEQLTALNNEKVEFQNQIQGLKQDIEAANAALSQEKELKESAEKKISELQAEVKLSLVESLKGLRVKAGKPEIEKLEERSLDSLRDSIADLRAELTAIEMKEAKGAIAEEHKVESVPAEENKTPEVSVVEDFSL